MWREKIGAVAGVKPLPASQAEELHRPPQNERCPLTLYAMMLDLLDDSGLMLSHGGDGQNAEVWPREAEAAIHRMSPRYTDKLSQLSYDDIEPTCLGREKHVVFTDLRKLANAIEFKYAALNAEKAVLLQMERDREAGISGYGHKAA
jgi:hypothetical protein